MDKRPLRLARNGADAVSGIRRPVLNFVLRNGLPEDSRGRREEISRLAALPWHEGAVESVLHMWTWPVYSLVAATLPSARLSDQLSEDCVNIVVGEELREIADYDPRLHFVVAIRADFRSFPYANLEIVQNRAAAGRRSIYIPHLPQIGLVGRDAARSKVETVAFFGEAKNLWKPKAEVAQIVHKLGLDFELVPPESWNDYSGVDIALGIRSLDKRRHNNKPPTKLFNAWLANVPFIGGCDSAFVQCGEPGVDYLKVSNEAELLAALLRLRDEPQTYKSLIARGKLKATQFSVFAIRKRWLSIIEDRILPDFRRWSAQTRWMRLDRSRRALWYLLGENPPGLWLQKSAFALSRR